jgi:hypothetical protein
MTSNVLRPMLPVDPRTATLAERLVIKCRRIVEQEVARSRPRDTDRWKAQAVPCRAGATFTARIDRAASGRATVRLAILRRNCPNPQRQRVPKAPVPRVGWWRRWWRRFVVFPKHTSYYEQRAWLAGRSAPACPATPSGRNACEPPDRGQASRTAAAAFRLVAFERPGTPKRNQVDEERARTGA